MRRQEHAYGIIAIRRKSDQWETFLVLHQKGHWAFPKGHSEPGETPVQTATREFKEETGGEVIRFLELPFLEEEYSFSFQEDLIIKKVTYFFALVKDAGSLLQKKEIAESRWLILKEAEKLATFSETKQICQQAEILLNNVDKDFLSTP